MRIDGGWECGVKYWFDQARGQYVRSLCYPDGVVLGTRNLANLGQRLPVVQWRFPGSRCRIVQVRYLSSKLKLVSL